MKYMREKTLKVALTGLSKRLRVAGEMGNVTGDFLIFVFLMLVKLSYVHSEKLVHLSELTVKCTGCRLILRTLVEVD